MNKPLVSIAVPVYGVEKYIEKCTISLFEQTYQNLEYIFVNDCTKDKSIEILNSIIEQYPNRKPFVKIINHIENKGLSETRNTAINNCKGEFIISVDSDDWLEPNAVETLISKQQEKNADIVYGNIICNDNIRKVNFLIPKPMEKKEFLIYILSNRYHHEVCSRLIRRNLYIDHNIRVENPCHVGEDWQVMPKLIYYAKTVDFIDKDIYHYYIDKPTSYVHAKRDYEKNSKFYINELKSIEVIHHFFLDKEDFYRDAISVFFIKKILSRMDFAVTNNDKKLFYHFNTLLDKCYDKDVLLVAGKNSRIRLSIKRNFYFYKMWMKFLK